MNYKLPAELTVENATATLREISASLSTGENIIDLLPLEKVDSSSIAVLLSLQRYANQKGLSLQFQNPSTNLQSLITLYGVGDLLAIKH